MSRVKFEKNEGLGVYARLLAGSDLNVVHANIDTAGYCSENKTIYLPYFNKDVPEETKVHLSAHEVLHFLNPADYQYEEEVNERKPVILNILDDCRIEKNGVKRFAGLNYYFKHSYKYLDESGFLEGKGSLIDSDSTRTKIEKVMGSMDNVIGQADDTTAPFLTRLNAHLKLNTIGRRNRTFEFTDEEDRVKKMCDDIETWEDVLVCHDEVLKLHEKEMQEHPERFKDGDPTENYNPLNSSDITDSNMETISVDEFLEKLKNGEIDPENIKKVKRSNYSPKDRKKAEEHAKQNPNTSTEQNDDNSFELNSLFDGNKEISTYKVDFSKTGISNVIPYQEVSQNIRERKYISANVKEYISKKNNTIRDMVLTFNRLKNARQKLNEKRNITGEIDFNKVIHYQTDEKIFRSKVIRTKKKNHGFIMLLDYSGSMDGVLDILSDQIIRLASFCKRVGIPYKVYMFTSRGYQQRRNTPTPRLIDHNELDTNESTVLYEVLSSEIPNQNEAMSNFKSVCLGKSNYSSNSTPIYSSLLAMPRLLREMEVRYRLDKLNLFVFTDGGDTDGVKCGRKTLTSLGQCTIQYNGIKATVKKQPKCYFDELDIFYEIYKNLFNINISTFFMSDNPYHETGGKCSRNITSDELFVLEDEWGDVFFSMSEKYFEIPQNDSFFVKTLMQKIM